MRELSKEMQKAGIIDELMEEALDDMDSEDVEKESEAQVCCGNTGLFSCNIGLFSSNIGLFWWGV